MNESIWLMVLGFVGFCIGYFCLPTTYKGIPLLGIFFVVLRRSKYCKWLMCPIIGNDNWYYDIVEEKLRKLKEKNTNAE
jgi:hypothetical protein